MLTFDSIEVGNVMVEIFQPGSISDCRICHLSFYDLSFYRNLQISAIIMCIMVYGLLVKSLED